MVKRGGFEVSNDLKRFYMLGVAEIFLSEG